MMRALQGSPAFGPSPQQASPAFPAQYPAPYTPVQTNGGGMTEMITAIMPIFILMMLMMMMRPMMAGMASS